MIFILDTDTLIFMIRGLKPSVRIGSLRKRALKVARRCRKAQRQGDVVGLSAITVSELAFGAHKSDDFEQEMAAVRRILLPFELFAYDAVKCPEHYGVIRHHLEEIGQPLGAMDLLIAAHAVSLGASLVTNNREHFQRVPGLTVVNWS